MVVLDASLKYGAPIIYHENRREEPCSCIKELPAQAQPLAAALTLDGPEVLEPALMLAGNGKV
jgi:hypothetical protein